MSVSLEAAPIGSSTSLLMLGASGHSLHMRHAFGNDFCQLDH